MKVPDPTHGDCTHWKWNIKEVLALNYLQGEQQDFQRALEEALMTHQWQAPAAVPEPATA
jgi:hypothetical protein